MRPLPCLSILPFLAGLLTSCVADPGLAALGRSADGTRGPERIPVAPGTVEIDGLPATGSASGPLRLFLRPRPAVATLPAEASAGLLVDGDWDRLLRDLRPVANGHVAVTWRTLLEANGPHTLRPLARLASGDWLFGDERVVHVTNAFRLVHGQNDPVGDDRGLSGDLVPPGAPGFEHHPMDIRGVHAWLAGGTLKLVVRMAAISPAWTPPAGFDHVTLTIFFDDPSRTGATWLPRLGGSLADAARAGASLQGMRDWDCQVFCHGWGSAAYDAAGSAPDRFGPALGAPVVRAGVDGPNTITVLLRAADLGAGHGLDGWRVWVTAFDYDGLTSEYRKVLPKVSDWGFTCADPGRFDEAWRYRGLRIADAADAFTIRLED